MKEIKKKPDPIDIYVGSRIRLRRNILKISQEKLGEQLGVTFQQIQKYEKGTNRVGASRLRAISEVLKVPISFFFEEISSSHPGSESVGSGNEYMDFCSSNEGIQLIRAFINIKDPKIRKKVIDLARLFSEEGE